MQGQLFTQDFLLRGVQSTPPWIDFTEAGLDRFAGALRSIYAELNVGSTLNEAQTEQLVIERVLAELGWGTDYLPQVNLSKKRRADVPDILLFPNAQAKSQALAESRDDRRYRHGLAILEAKRWMRALDRGDASEAQDPDAPSSQMLRYLSRVDVVADRALKWGILSNGAVWRLYWQDARSRAEEFFEIDVASALAVPGTQRALDDPEPRHALKLFFLFFNRAAFLSQTWEAAGNRSFHAYARGEARLYEERVSKDLGARVFEEIFPRLAGALARGDVQAGKEEFGHGRMKRQRFTAAYLDEVREATLILLYRLLFLFYAEDRLLLPARDPRYLPYSVRALRERVRDDSDAGKAMSSRLDHIWRELKGVFLLINEGDDAVGMPAYNGGLFDRARSPLLERTQVPDNVMAPIIDALSRRTEDLLKLWINYRDLSVSHLGGIYERLLEYTLVHEVQAADGFDREEFDRISAQPASFARKVSGSYYTHDDLVRLLLRESVGRLCDERVTAFEDQIKKWKGRSSLGHVQWNLLDGDADTGQRDAIEPATRILELTVCDPAMGSGHFLVALVDYLADRVLEAASLASQLVNAQPWAAHVAESGRVWVSPVVARIAHIRQTIKRAAAEHHWAVTDAQLDDRHIVRRMILKKTIFGVDKNPMAVELAKTALWLHTFTVGAPLSFLDHHLKLGDSLHGERLPDVQDGLHKLGMLFQQNELDRLAQAAGNLSRVADLTDVDIAEARLSRDLSREADEAVAPLHALLDFWRAMRWMFAGWPVAKPAQLARLGDQKLQAALLELLSDHHNLVSVLAEGRVGGVGGTDAAAGASGERDSVVAANTLLEAVRKLALRESFFHWWTAFPTVFAADASGGFDVVIGNPPWDRIKLQEVEWFAERDTRIAMQARAADRKRLIGELQKKRSPLWRQYVDATERAEANARVLGKAGDYPLLGGGDVNLYSLFVERAQALVKGNGIVALLTPSGIAADKGAAPFFRSITQARRLGALYDFENKKVFFPDVHASFKFCAFVFGGPSREFDAAQCAFYLHSLDELDDPDRRLTLTSEDFVRANPNTSAAPVFRKRRDAQITLRLYAEHPVLVRHGADDKARGRLPNLKAWPVKYLRMFDMTNDSQLFLSSAELETRGYRRTALGHWALGDNVAVPLYEGKMVQMLDHRAADVVVNQANLKRAAQQEAISSSEKASPTRQPAPQYWVDHSDARATWAGEWGIAYKSVTAPTNVRTMIAAILPACGVGNSMAMLVPEPGAEAAYAACAPLLIANLSAFAFDFCLRQKVQGQNLNWFIVEQSVVIAPERFEASIGGIRIADFIRDQVLHLSYTAHDLAAFARDLGHVDTQGGELPPFRWDDEDRRRRMAALDGLFMHLYGLSEDNAAYILDTFPIVREHDEKAFGHFRTKADVLAQLRRIGAGILAV